MISTTAAGIIVGVFTLIGVAVGWGISMWLQRHG